MVAGGCRRSCGRGYTGENFVPDAIKFCFAHSALSMRNVVIKKRIKLLHTFGFCQQFQLFFQENLKKGHTWPKRE